MRICPVCQKSFPDDVAVEWCPDDGSLLYAAGEGGAKPLEPGDVVAGKYELLEVMPRRGGAGRTFKARQTALNRVVELRLLPAHTITKPADHARFQREVATWGRLRSDYLVRLYDSGFTENNAPYMALEWVEGGSLGQRLRTEGPLPLALAQTVAEHILEALVAAHEAAVLHRDISPEALVLGARPDGSPYCRLTGFGLAKHMGDGEDDPTAITMAGEVVGNPAYMAPETILAGVLDPRTDLYAVGVTLYELLAGRRPFPGSSLADMLRAHVQGVPEPLERHRPDVPPGISQLISRLLSKDPAKRFESAREALLALQSPEFALAQKTPSPQAPAAGPSNVGLSLMLGALVLLGALAAGLFLWLRS